MPDAVDTILGILDCLVRHDTVSRNSNLALIDDVADRLSVPGIKTAIFRDPDGGKANILATIGPDAPGGIMLAGHTDVVPVDGQDWSSPPFTATRRDDRLFGRGTADMKGFIAVALAIAPSLATAGLRHPIYLAFTYDEETGCFGAQALADVLRRMPHPPRLLHCRRTDVNARRQRSQGQAVA